MSDRYTTKKIGDILRLPFDLEQRDAGVIEAGGYVLLSVDDLCGVARVNEAPSGRLVATNRLVYVRMADLCRFLPTGMRVEPLEM